MLSVSFLQIHGLSNTKDSAASQGLEKEDQELVDSQPASAEERYELNKLSLYSWHRMCSKTFCFPYLLYVTNHSNLMQGTPKIYAFVVPIIGLVKFRV